MVSVEDFYKFKVEGKYVDLILRIDDKHDINLHKILVCEKCSYFGSQSRSYFGSQSCYTHNNIINISLPNDTSFESFNVAIDFIYGKYVTTDNVTFLVNTFQFLGVNNSYILDYLYKIIPIDRSLSEDHKNAIIKTADDNLLRFYGNGLLDDVDFPTDEIIFGKNMPEEWLLSLFKLKDDNYSNMNNYEWHHFDNMHSDSGDIKFSALAYSWTISRNIFGYEETYDNIGLELNIASTDIFRIVLILFADGQPPRRRYLKYDCNHQEDFNELSGHSKTRRGCGINVYPQLTDRIRVSLFIQNISHVICSSDEE
jgi:hypothetical protein